MKLTVMTFNLRVDVPADGSNAWPCRKEAVGALIRSIGPDVIGTQEGRYGMLRDLDRELPEYSRIGEGRAGHESGDPGLDECCAIYYRRERLHPVEQGQFYLSLTPDIPASVSWNSNCPRLCTWALFQSLHAPSYRFYMFNTHLDHMSQEAREQGAALVTNRITMLRNAQEAPAVLTGDFNASPDNPAIATLKAGLIDAYSALHGRPGSTFHDFRGGAEGEPIDYIWASADTEVTQTVVHRDSTNGAYPSDHYPVSCRVSLPAAAAADLRPQRS